MIAQGIASQDSGMTYGALRVYLMLQDKSHYNADIVKTRFSTTGRRTTARRHLVVGHR